MPSSTQPRPRVNAASAAGNSASRTTRVSVAYLNAPDSTNAAGNVQVVNGYFAAVNQGTNTPYGGTSGNGGQAASAIGAVSTSALGTAMYLYEEATTGSGNQANWYGSALAIQVNADGSITGISTSGGTGGSPVPLPAAVWLLGSGVLGLFGIGRRRVATAA